MNIIEEYKSVSNRKYISDYLNILNKRGKYDHVKKIIKGLEKLEQNNLYLLIKVRIVKKLKTYSNIYELIINWQEANYRIFFSIVNNKIILTHIFNKQKEKTPKKEIKIANNRFKNLIN